MITTMHFPVLAVMLLFLSAFLVEIFGSKNAAIRNGITFIGTTIALVLIYALIKPVLFEGQIIAYWMGNWEPVAGYAIGIGYEIDALSLVFAVLVVTTFWLGAIYSFGDMNGKHHLGHYYTLFLMLSGSCLGLVMTGDIFNMFVMIEIMTFSTVALTAFNTEHDAALEGAFKYLVNASIGSSFTLTGIALLYLSCHTLNMAQLASILSGGFSPITLVAFGLMLTGFAVKSDLVPFHAPYADANTVAPSAISMLLSGMVTKAGVYGFIRLIYIIFRAMDASQMQILIVLFGALTMFIGVTMALAQHDFKRLLAFHSISQVGYIITAVSLGTALGLTGGIFHAINHTLFKGLLFLCAGAVLSSAGTTNLDKLGGLSKKMPVTTLCFLTGAASISGLPPFNGFVSKWTVYQAVYEKALESGNFVFVFAVVTAVVVSVMTLASFVKVTHSVFFGQLRPEHENVKEVPMSMQLPMIIMSALCVLTGVFYNTFNAFFINPAVNAALDVENYIDSMLGFGYAFISGAVNIESAPAEFSYWNPIIWLLLFIIVFAAFGIIVILTGNERGRIRVDDGASAKYDVFFSGEKAEFSHAGGSDLFWGFKKDWKKYYDILEGLHSGSVNDYTSYLTMAAAVIMLFMFAFMG